jgi:hypothetical protein
VSPPVYAQKAMTFCARPLHSMLSGLVWGLGAERGDATSGVLSFFDPIYTNFEQPIGNGQIGINHYSVVVRISDGSLVDTQTINVSLSDVNERPSFQVGGSTRSIPVFENNTSATRLSGLDPDNGATLSFSIIGGADASKLRSIRARGFLLLRPRRF